MENIIVKVSDFSKIPCGRYRRDSETSGEAFREDVLEFAFDKATSDGVKVLLNIDGTEGKPSSFYNEALGGLVRKKRAGGDSQITVEKLWNTIEIISERPSEVKRVKEYAEDTYKEENNLSGGF